MSEPTALGALGGRISRHTAIYASGNITTFVMGIANLAVLTRVLEIEEFGQLALLLMLAVLLTILYNLGSLQGAFLRVFGSSGDEDVDDAAEDEAPGGDKRQALGSAIVLTALVGTLGTAIVVPFAGDISTLLLGHPGEADAVVVVAVSAAFGSVWRLLNNVLRYERRPVAFVSLSSVRPVLVLACTIPLVTTGHGVLGAVGGVALGSALSVCVALVVTKPSWVFALRRADVDTFFRRGAIFIPIVLSFWVLHNADLYLVSAFASDSSVAMYRVASRIAVGASYFVSAFLMAWGPLGRTSLNQAVLRERSRGEATAAIFTWFSFVCLWLILSLAVLADVLIRVAPAAYGGAAPLIPVIGFAFLVFGAFRIANRGASFPGKRQLYARLAVGIAISFVVIGLVLVPVLGGYGAALGQIIVFGVGTLVLFRQAHRNETPLALDWSRVLRAFAVALVLLGVGLAAGPALGPWRVAVDLAAVAAFPVLLVIVGAVSREDARGVVAFASQARPRRDRAGAVLRGLVPADRRVLARLLRGGDPPAAVALSEGLDQDALFRRTVEGLRAAAGVGEPHPLDGRLGRYLLVPGAVAERDVLARSLWKATCRRSTSTRSRTSCTGCARRRRGRGRRRSPMRLRRPSRSRARSRRASAVPGPTAAR